MRNGKFWNNGSEGIDCDAEPVAPWVYGKEIMKALRKVSCDKFEKDSGFPGVSKKNEVVQYVALSKEIYCI